MPDSIQYLLDNLPEAAVQERQGKVLYANPAARSCLPGIREGEALPFLPALEEGCDQGTGSFSSGGVNYVFQMSRAGEDGLILFHPCSASPLSAPQLEGALRQLRGFLGEFAAELGPAASPAEEPLPLGAREGFLKTYCRTLRLVNNLDYLSWAAAPGGVRFRPATVDLASLCRRAVQGAAPLLAQAGVTLRCELESSLLIPGDPELLERMLWELIVNGAQAAEEGTVLIRLRRQSRRALLTLSDSGGALTQQQMDAVLQRPSAALPRPDQGAGLGLSIVRSVVELHGGELLMGLGGASLRVLVSLPTEPLGTNVQVRTPDLDRYGGLSPMMVELSDVLPARLFRTEGLD